MCALILQSSVLVINSSHNFRSQQRNRDCPSFHFHDGRISRSSLIIFTSLSRFFNSLSRFFNIGFRNFNVNSACQTKNCIFGRSQNLTTTARAKPVVCLLGFTASRAYCFEKLFQYNSFFFSIHTRSYYRTKCTPCLFFCPRSQVKNKNAPKGVFKYTRWLPTLDRFRTLNWGLIKNELNLLNLGLSFCK